MNPTLWLELPIVIDDEPLVSPPRPRRRFRTRLRRFFGAIALGLEWITGAAALIVGLSALAALPIAQFLSLGYLLEASGRVARTGRLRDGWIGVRRAARVGGIVAGSWLSLLPSRLVSSLAASAELIDPDGPISRAWRVGLVVAVLLTITHVVASCARGGRLRHFAWPPGSLIWLVRRLRRGGLYVESRDAACAFVEQLRLSYYFRLGAIGFVGSMAWLIVPVTLLALGRRVPLLGILGVPALAIVATWLPFLQVQFAMDGRFATLFGTKGVRERFRRAPWAFALAFALTVIAAIPLYLLKIEVVPRDAAWLPGLLFIGFLFPSRLATGWAYARGARRENRRHWFWRGVGRLTMIPIAGAYVLIVYFAQYTSWGGSWDLYEQHAFLLPVPFLGYW